MLTAFVNWTASRPSRLSTLIAVLTVVGLAWGVPQV